VLLHCQGKLKTWWETNKGWQRGSVLGIRIMYHNVLGGDFMTTTDLSRESEETTGKRWGVWGVQTLTE